MQNISISYNKNNKLIEKLQEQENIEVLKKKTLFQKLFFSKKEFTDIYFHFGQIDENAIKNIQNSKLTIVNSKAMKNKLMLHTKTQANKIEVIYPSIDVLYQKPKELKEKICGQIGINPKKKTIFFTAKNFKFSGIKEFISIVLSLSQDNFQVLIAGDKKQITSLKFQMSNIQNDKIVFLEDYQNIDELFLISDIFLLPTHNSTFASNVLKAMFCKCAVFTTSSNHSSELIDVFSTMESPDDRTTIFKIDALLLENKDLKLIKKQNRQKALEYTLEKNLEKINDIIRSLNLT